MKLTALATHFPYADLSNKNIGNDILTIIPKQDAIDNVAVAFAIEDGKLCVAMEDPERCV